MTKSYFEVIRSGINTTFQDLGRKNLYHIGIPFSGAMDNRNFILANAIAGNKENTPVIEFAYQGPLLKFRGEKVRCMLAHKTTDKISSYMAFIPGEVLYNITSDIGGFQWNVDGATVISTEGGDAAADGASDRVFSVRPTPPSRAGSAFGQRCSDAARRRASPNLCRSRGRLQPLPK